MCLSSTADGLFDFGRRLWLMVRRPPESDTRLAESRVRHPAGKSIHPNQLRCTSSHGYCLVLCDVTGESLVSSSFSACCLYLIGMGYCHLAPTDFANVLVPNWQERFLAEPASLCPEHFHGVDHLCLGYAEDSFSFRKSSAAAI